MALLILGENMLGKRGAHNYRGTYREGPPHADALPENSEYNRLFQWYCKHECKSDGANDPDRIRRLATLLRSEVGRKNFEIIEALRVGEIPVMGYKLLGYDLSNAWYYSLLSWGLDLHRAMESTSLPTAVRDLSALVETHFRPALNEFALFSDEQTAAFCLRSMLALQSLAPDLWENDAASKFEVVAIFKALTEEGAEKGAGAEKGSGKM